MVDELRKDGTTSGEGDWLSIVYIKLKSETETD
jgi:hypothetical protein